MAYCALKWEMLWARPYRHNSQPTGFSGRREATIAPMVEKNTALSVLSSQESKMCVCGWEMFRAKSKRATTVRVKESPQSDHASQEAVRVLIPPTPRSRSFVSSVTTPLYSTTVCQALRQPLRSQAVSELPRIPKRRSSQNTNSTHFVNKRMKKGQEASLALCTTYSITATRARAIPAPPAPWPWLKCARSLIFAVVGDHVEPIVEKDKFVEL